MGEKPESVKKTRVYLNDLDIDDLTKAKVVLSMQSSLLNIVCELVESRDGNTGGHIERTRHYLGILLGALIENGKYAREIDTWDIWLVLNSAQLHDVGKITVSDSILQKPGKLTDEEFEQIKEHTVSGERIIEKIGGHIKHRAFLEHAKVLAGTHHEKWDGGGYPRGLKGDDIPLQGRLMAIADVYDALISDRPYKKAFTHEQAVEIIKNGKGTLFDPILVDVFLGVSNEFERISAELKESESK